MNLEIVWSIYPKRKHVFEVFVPLTRVQPCRMAFVVFFAVWYILQLKNIMTSIGA